MFMIASDKHKSRVQALLPDGQEFKPRCVLVDCSNAEISASECA
jgi:hypothetical protein